jgi:hypothetical protein
MKQVSKFLFLFASICFLSSNIFAETLIVLGDYTTPSDISGDLIITNGSVNISSAGDLLIRGDLKVNGGFVYMSPSAGKLRVFGDLIVTNTLPNGDASIIVHDDIEVTGAIITKSMSGAADITTTGASSNGSITAESISTNGSGTSAVQAKNSITVVGQISTKSSSGHADVWAENDSIFAGKIKTDADDAAGVVAVNTIRVIGAIWCKSVNSTIEVSSSSGDLFAGEIFVDTAASHARVKASNNIVVVGAIKVKSATGDADVRNLSSPGGIKAGSIHTDGLAFGRVEANDFVEVRGDIITNSENQRAPVQVDSGHIYAGSISTKSISSDAYVYSTASPGIIVRRDIITRNSSGQGTSFVWAVNSGDIIANRIITRSDYQASVDSVGNINVGGIIDAYSSGGNAANSDAYVKAAGGDLSAERIFTDGAAHCYVSGTGNVDIKDIISTKSSAGTAYVSASSNVNSRSIETDGSTSGYVNATNGNINVAGDIRTNSSSGDTYVKATNGNITARSIQTMGVADDSIQAAAGSGEFQWFPDRTDTAVTIKDSEFYLDKDHTLPTLLSLDGSCTLNGNGHRLELSGSGGLLIKSGSSVLLKNILIDNVVNNSIRCEDDTATLSIRDVIMSQSSSTTWSNGSLQIFGHCEIQGSGTGFYYDSSETSTIHQNSTFLIGDGATFCYSYSLTRNNFTMVDDTSRFHFDNSTLLALEDVDLLLGTAVFDREVLFQSDSGKTIYFGNGTPADDLALEFHLRSRFDLSGTFTNLP